ncbi:hypothetical protein BKG76_01595 [Mycobacteroides franklinii]|uniref:DUF3558 domain-containing protein n=1 Tax=Mycobacteroides franklinii TaxID=948102 RepID=A0A1S1LDL6_9MYCO|nr:DUF3558 family protein [Mycobacteroides franklinii]OHU30480.1 hypothetical protein BKG76_01595 [Mycobacteroides franklinii]
MIRLGLACAVAVLAAGCATSPGITKPADVSASTSTPAVTATSGPHVSSTLTVPHPPPNQWNDGTSYDPCLMYTADQIRSWGVDPTRVSDRGVEDRQLRGCRWASDGWSLELSVANSKVSTYLDPGKFTNAHPVDIGGLAGAMYQGSVPQLPVCTVILPAEHATVAVVVVIADPKNSSLSDPCVKATEVATVVAPTLPK